MIYYNMSDEEFATLNLEDMDSDSDSESSASTPKSQLLSSPSRSVSDDSRSPAPNFNEEEIAANNDTNIFASDPEMQASFVDTQQSYGDICASSSSLMIAGKASNKKRAIMTHILTEQSEEFMVLFCTKMRDLGKVSDSQIKQYMNEIKKIPRYWTKNIDMTIEVLLLKRKYGKNPNITQIKEWAKSENLNVADLYRYVRFYGSL